MPVPFPSLKKSPAYLSKKCVLRGEILRGKTGIATHMNMQFKQNGWFHSVETRLAEIKLRYVVFLTLILVVLWAMLAWYFANQSYDREFNSMVEKGQRHAQETSTDVKDSIFRNLHYVAGIPETFKDGLSIRPAVEKFGPNALPSVFPKENNLKRWTADPVLISLNRYLALAQRSLNVDLIYVVNAAGDCISASSQNTDTTPIGSNYADRNWYIDAYNGRRSVQYAMGRTTHIAGLYFSSPIIVDGQFLGAIVAKVNIPSLSFLTRQADVYVTDINGVIIMAHDHYMEMMAIPDAPVSRIPEKNKLELYQKNKFDEIKIETWQEGSNANLKKTQGEDAPHVLVSADLPEYGLKVFAEADLPELPLLERERNSDFILMASIADLATLIAASLFLYFQSMRKAKMRIAESEEQLRLMVSGVKDYAIIMLNTAGQVKNWNSGAEKIYGYKAEDIIGNSISQFYPDEVVAQLKDWLEIAAKEGSYKTEGWQVRKGGSQFMANVIITAIRDNTGQLRGFAKVTRNITERKRAEAKLRVSEARYKRIALHLDEVREEEQVRIAREIHDEMGSTLTALKMSVHWLTATLPAEMTPLVAEAEHMDKLVCDTTRAMRNVVSQLMPTQLQDFGFVVAVERYVQNFQKQMGIEYSLALPENGLTLDENQSSVMFRILQESLNNIAKHAQADKVSIRFINREHSLILLVRDNGVGFDTNVRKHNSFGLLGIRARAPMVNGRARISSRPGNGTQVVVSIPLAKIQAKPTNPASNS